MEYSLTTYSDGHGHYHAAIHVPWNVVAQVLGRPHEGYPDDDEILVRWLTDQGAPGWVQEAEGWIDEEGWGLIGPRLVGWEAIHWYERHGGQLNKYADPIDMARGHLSLEEAIAVAREDPSLLFWEPDMPAR
jgi:hypothetical protein